MRGVLHGRVPDDSSSSRAGALRPLRGARRGGGPTCCWSRRGLSWGFSGTLLRTSRTSCRTCRSSMLLCHWWGTRWWMPSGTSICTSLCRLSKCPRSRLHAVVAAGAGFLWCRRRNSWWKCPDSCSWLLLCSRTLLLMEVFKVFSPGQDYLVVWEQIVDIPVPQDFGGLGGDGGFQGFSPGQGTPAADVEQIVDIPVPQDRREGGGLQSSLPGQGSTAYLEQIVDVPCS